MLVLGNSYLAWVWSDLKGFCVNFYKHHIGDYDAHTQHLTWSQDLSYRRLLSAYYLRERPLPNDLPMIYRLARATEAAQKASCRQVLGEFFYLADDGCYHHRRCDKEIQQYQAQSSTNRSNAAHRIGQRNASETEPNRSPNQNQNQIPDKSNTVPPPKKGNGETPPVTKAGMWAIELRKRKVQTTSMHPTMLKLIEDGFELPAVIEALEVARQRKPFPELIPIGYLDPIIRKPPKAAQASWWASEPATLAKAAEIGITPRPGEDWNELRDRIRTHA